jgi:hypothetical protein
MTENIVAQIVVTAEADVIKCTCRTCPIHGEEAQKQEEKKP